MLNYSLILALAFSQSLLAATVNVPIALNEQNIPTVKLNLNGQPHTFILDLGSREGLHLPKRMMTDIPELTLTGKQQRSLDLAGREHNSESFTISAIDVNGMTFSNVSGVELNPWGLSLSWGGEPEQEADPTLPVIGLGLFAHHSLTLDYSRKLLTIDDGQQTAQSQISEDWIALPFKLTDEGIVIAVSYQGKRYYPTLDSGASLSIIKSEILPKDAERLPCGQFYPDIEDNECRLIAARIAEHKDGPDIAMLMVDGLPEQFSGDGLLGTNFLQAYRIRINLPERQVRIKRID